MFLILLGISNFSQNLRAIRATSAEEQHLGRTGVVHNRGRTDLPPTVHYRADRSRQLRGCHESGHDKGQLRQGWVQKDAELCVGIHSNVIRQVGIV